MVATDKVRLQLQVLTENSRGWRNLGSTQLRPEDAAWTGSLKRDAQQFGDLHITAGMHIMMPNCSLAAIFTALAVLDRNSAVVVTRNWFVRELFLYRNGSVSHRHGAFFNWTWLLKPRCSFVNAKNDVVGEQCRLRQISSRNTSEALCLHLFLIVQLGGGASPRNWLPFVMNTNVLYCRPWSRLRCHWPLGHLTTDCCSNVVKQVQPPPQAQQQICRDTCCREAWTFREANTNGAARVFIYPGGKEG